MFYVLRLFRQKISVTEIIKHLLCPKYRHTLEYYNSKSQIGKSYGHFIDDWHSWSPMIGIVFSPTTKRHWNSQTNRSTKGIFNSICYKCILKQIYLHLFFTSRQIVESCWRGNSCDQTFILTTEADICNVLCHKSASRCRLQTQRQPQRKGKCSLI